MMILSNPLFKNISDWDQRKLAKIIYKAEMVEIYMRDKQIIRVNESFEDIVESVANMLNDAMGDDPEEEDDQERF